MKGDFLKYCKGVSTRWLVVLSFLLGFIAISSSVSYSTIRPLKTKAGLILRNKPKYSATLVFRIKPGHLATKQCATLPTHNRTTSFLKLNDVCTLKLNHLSGLFASIKTTFRLPRRAAIPQSADEKISSYPLG